jgi:hypothetical protein
MELAEIKKALLDLLVLHRGTDTYKLFDRIHNMILGYEDSRYTTAEPDGEITGFKTKLGAYIEVVVCCKEFRDAIDGDNIEITLRGGRNTIVMINRGNPHRRQPIQYCPWCGIKTIIKN